MDLIDDGMTRVAYVTALADQTAPTLTELGGGTLLQRFITADGLVGWEPTTAPVDNTGLDSTFGTNLGGRDEYKTQPMLRLKKQTSGDTVYSIWVKNTAGFVVIRRDLPEYTDWEAGQSVETYPIVCGRRRRLQPVANTLTRYEVDMFLYLAPTPDAVVAS